MQRFTISLDDALATAFDHLLASRGYRNRSEAIRDLIRAELAREDASGPAEGFCVANLSYVYNHHRRELAERLTALQHERHDLVVATMHVHLDHDNCLESAILRGPTAEVRAFATAVVTQPEVRHGALHLVAAILDEGGQHRHDAPARADGSSWHLHLTPKT